MAVNIHITIIELNALHTKRQNLFQELDAVIHLLMEAKHWGLRKSRNATSLNSRDRKSGSAGMPRPISYAVFCLKKKIFLQSALAGTDRCTDQPSYPPTVDTSFQAITLVAA